MHLEFGNGIFNLQSLADSVANEYMKMKTTNGFQLPDYKLGSKVFQKVS